MPENQLRKEETLLEALDRARANLVKVREAVEARIAAEQAAAQKAES
jgi:hypothetical protein